MIGDYLLSFLNTIANNTNTSSLFSEYILCMKMLNVTNDVSDNSVEYHLNSVRINESRINKVTISNLISDPEQYLNALNSLQKYICGRINAVSTRLYREGVYWYHIPLYLRYYIGLRKCKNVFDAYFNINDYYQLPVTLSKVNIYHNYFKEYLVFSILYNVVNTYLSNQLEYLHTSPLLYKDDIINHLDRHYNEFVERLVNSILFLHNYPVDNNLTCTIKNISTIIIDKLNAKKDEFIDAYKTYLMDNTYTSYFINSIISVFISKIILELYSLSNIVSSSDITPSIYYDSIVNILSDISPSLYITNSVGQFLYGFFEVGKYCYENIDSSSVHINIITNIDSDILYDTLVDYYYGDISLLCINVALNSIRNLLLDKIPSYILKDYTSYIVYLFNKYCNSAKIDKIKYALKATLAYIYTKCMLEDTNMLWKVCDKFKNIVNNFNDFGSVISRDDLYSVANLVTNNINNYIPTVLELCKRAAITRLVQEYIEKFMVNDKVETIYSVLHDYYSKDLSNICITYSLNEYLYTHDFVNVYKL